MKALHIAILTSTLAISLQVLGTRGDNGTLRVVPEYSDEDYGIEDIMAMCNESFRIEESYLTSLNESGSFPDETDKTPKCYIQCVLENINIVSEDGVFDTELTSLVFAGERGGQQMYDLREMAIVCANRNETCKCERSYNFVKCLMSMEIDKYLLSQN